MYGRETALHRAATNGHGDAGNLRRKDKTAGVEMLLKQQAIK